MKNLKEISLEMTNLSCRNCGEIHTYEMDEAYLEEWPESASRYADELNTTQECCEHPNYDYIGGEK